MERHSLYIESKYDRLPISVLESIPDGKPRAVVYLVHGLCGCKERFLPFIDYLNSNGFACVASDLRGHGSSIRNENDRGYMYNGGAKAVVADVDSVVDHIYERFDGMPLFMLGHSMGSLAVRAYAKFHDCRLDALIVCGSPSLNPFTSLAYTALNLWCLSGGGRRRVRYLQRLISDRYNRKFQHEGPQAWTCSDPEERRLIAADPRCNFIITADCAATLMDLFSEVYSRRGWHSKKPGLPVYFLSGDDDPCMISFKKFVRSVDCMRACGYSDVNSRTYAGMRHEILHEIKKQSVWDDILTVFNR